MTTSDDSDEDDDNIRFIINDSIALSTLGQRSIEAHRQPFWNNVADDVSKQLWIPSFQKEDTQLINGFANNAQQSSFCYPPINIDEDVESEIVDKDIMRCRKIRFYPNREQVDLINRCFGATRYFYNRTLVYIQDRYQQRLSELLNLAKNGCIHMIKDQQCCKEIDNDSAFFCNKHRKSKIKWNISLSLPNLRQNIMKSNADLNNDELWQADVPYDTRQLAIKDAIAAYKSFFELKKINPKANPPNNFKKKKHYRQIANIDHRVLKLDMSLFSKTLKNKKRIRFRRKMKGWFNKNISEAKDFTILREKPGRYYLCLPIEIKKRNNPTLNSTVALDPGVRTFQSFYSNDEVCGKLGDNEIEKLINLGERVSKLTSLMTKVKSKKTRANMRNRCFKLRNKIKRKVDDLHKKTAAFLCKNFKNIILPTFETSRMTKRLPERARKINNKTVRSMLSLSHYKFKQTLLNTAERECCNVIMCDEAYTSKTCGKCGNIDYNLGSSKWYNCSECDYEGDRDIHGARNILIRVLSYMH